MNDIDRAMKLMRIFVATIESLDQEQVDLLVSGKLKFTVAGPKKTRDVSPRAVDEVEILNRLNDCKDRIAAREILSAIKTRDALAAFARALKVHVVKHDRREDIESKIVEFVIGGKLRTEAIRSLNLKGSSGLSSDGESRFRLRHVSSIAASAISLVTHLLSKRAMVIALYELRLQYRDVPPADGS